MIFPLSLTGAVTYHYLLKPLFFQFDPEWVHERIVASGKLLGTCWCGRKILRKTLAYIDESLAQTLHGITFTNPIGLAAGFDYNADLTQILPSVGFGFGSVGTITNRSYGGNPRPMLGRLPKSKSLMVNKGFKNPGASVVSAKLSKLHFHYPVGISIGRSNTTILITQKQSIQDIIAAFISFEKAGVKNAYYELNISCPNLIGDITFYPPKNLRELLSEVTKLKLKKPIFIKMPIEKSDAETRAMLEEIVDFPIKGVIFGNLQKNRQDPALYSEEVNKFDRGNFSGKPTFKRSNELIALAYKNYGKKLTIIGCGGVFSAEDAYTKIKLGASLIQLITGMIFEGPTLIGQINYGLSQLLRADGFTNISQVIGVENR